MKKELLKNNWDFILYEIDGKKIISVVFYNSYVDISKSFVLNKEEMREIINKNWDYVLYENEGKYIISVLCGSIGIFEINIQLNTTEEECFLRRGIEYTDELAKQIQSSPQQYTDRNISDFSPMNL